MSDDPAYHAARLVIERYTQMARTIGTAESLTGGLLCATLTAVPGASNVVRGGLVVYATDLKASLAGVPVDELGRDGPVSESTVRSLASGAARRTGADVGIATTGVAGPDIQDGKAVGTVWIGLHVVGLPSQARVQHFAGDRDRIRQQTVTTALKWLLEVGDQSAPARN